MPLYDFICNQCKKPFEGLVPNHKESENVECPHCSSTDTKKMISRFKIAGRGDLRETTEFHGCHPAIESTNEKHVHGPNCNHKKQKK